MPKADDDRLKEAKEYLLEQGARATELRSKEREFHGLEREFRYEYDELVAEFAKSADVRHPRDVGQIRENLLGEFLDKKGYLPGRYQVSHTSVRAVSFTGHTSRELDILFTDASESVRLMNRKEAFGVYPLECTYGVIQVKSRLTKDVIADGLANIASYKRLIASPDSPTRAGRFGILFAYDSNLEWRKIVEEVDAFAKANPANTWCNAVFVLKQGMILHGDGSRGFLHNHEIEAIKDPKAMGRPDLHNLCLFNFYQTLISLLRDTDIGTVPIEKYFSLPLTSGDWWYRFGLGSFSEVRKCDEHGDYQKKISAANLAKIFDWSMKSQPMNPGKAFDLAFKSAGINDDVIARQNGGIFIYNPRNLGLKEILFAANGEVTFEPVEIKGNPIWVPFRYAEEEKLFEGCPACNKAASKRVEETDPA